MATVARLRYNPLSKNYALLENRNVSSPISNSSTISFPALSRSSFSSAGLSGSFLYHKLKLSGPEFPSKLDLSCGGGSGVGGIGYGSGGGGEDDGGLSEGGSHDDDSLSAGGFGVFGLFMNGWRSRVAADPQFPFKVLMEELVGVTACVLGDMASRPNFGLNELDFVFSTLVVGSILNFTLMYLLAPTAGGVSSNLPALFSTCPTSHMFEPGAYSVLERLGTFVYKGTVFAAVGFAAGLVGTAISNGLMVMRKKMDPKFETPNKSPPMLLNAATWAMHMGFSSNFRYQTLNGTEFLLEKCLPSMAFKTSVIVLRCLNNVLGGMSFVILARLTGSQSISEEAKTIVVMEDILADEKEKLIIRRTEVVQGDEINTK